MDVVGIDRPCMDCLIRVKQLPRPNQGAHVEENSWQGGGKVATALAALGRLGAECAIIGDTGSDSYGQFCKNDLEYHHVDTARLRVHEGAQTSLCFVLSDEETHGRSIMGKIGTCPKFALDDEDKALIKSAKILHLSWADENCLEAAKVAKENGVIVTFDGDYYHEEVNELLPYIDAFIGSEFFFDAYFKDDPETDRQKRCEKIRAKGPKICVFTFGADGCVVDSDEGYFEVPAAEVPRIVDTVGAGDVFPGAFLFGMLQEDWSLKKIAEFAGVVASLKCMQIGGRAGIPDFKTAEHFYQTGEILESDIPERVAKYSSFAI